MIINIGDAFVERRTPGASDDSMRRIIKSYKMAKTAQSIAGPIYQPSREWLPIYYSYMREVMHALDTEDVPALRNMYENLFRENLSTGLHGSDFQIVKKFMTAGQPIAPDHLNFYLENCVNGVTRFIRACRNTPVSVLSRPALGNPYSYDIDNVKVYPCAEYHYCYAEKIRFLLQEVVRPTVLELGGGFGGMAYYLMRDLPDSTYIAVDLPENAALQAFFLLSHFPERKILLYGEQDLSDISLTEYDAIILPSLAMEQISTDSVNLSFNSASLAEMSWETINAYIATLCRISRDYFFHMNHTEWEVSADLFPIDYEKFNLLFRYPTVWVLDQTKRDYHDFLYQRKRGHSLR